MRANQAIRMASYRPRDRERSGAIAAVLSFIFPGLGQAFLRHRRSALIFGLPVLLLVVGLVAWVARSGLTRAGVKLLDPAIALFGAALVLVVGLWWMAGILNAWRSGRRAPGVVFMVPAVLLFVVGASTIYGADWMWRLSSADQQLYNNEDPTIAVITPGPATPTPAATPYNPNATPTPVPTRPPDYVDPSDLLPTGPPPTIEPGPLPSFDITKIDARDDGWLNVLLIGLDRRCTPGSVVTGANSDTMIVVSANASTGAVYMFSFPRDTARVPMYVGNTYPGKLTSFAGWTKLHPELFPNPGQPALAYEIGYLLGIPIDYYASVDFCGFQTLVDEVGGVTVCNFHNIADDHLQFYLSTGLHELNGADALRYARSRHGMGGGDFARARRQQQLLVAIRAAVLQPQNLARLPDIVQAMAGVVHTDFPPDQVDQLLSLANEVQATPTAQYVFDFPDWAQHLPRYETNGRSVQFLRLDKIAALSEQVFGDKSLYAIGGAVPSTKPFDLPTPTPAPTDNANVC